MLTINSKNINKLHYSLYVNCYFFYDSGWAIKRGFITARAGRPDTYRGANNLLRMALDGKICLVLRPVGFTENKSMHSYFGLN